MDNEPPILPLRDATVAVIGEKRRFRLHNATLAPLGPTRVRLTLSAPNGSLEINMTRQEFWSLTSRFHEASAAAHLGEKPRRNRS